MKKHLSTILLVLMFLVGLSVLLYPLVSNYWNSLVQSKVIVNYESVLKNMEKKDYTAYFEAASKYNQELAELSFPLVNYDKVQGYDDILNIDGLGTMGYIDIEKINVSLPIYHGISEAVLNTAAGHIEGTSFPTGGKGTHCVLSAHRGLPSAKLFTDLDKVAIGDTFTITVLDRILTYEVDSILIVEPDVVEPLRIEADKDYCTLVTCTPYGINTHRLLVRGVRTDTSTVKAPVFVPNEALRIDPIIVTPAAAAPMLLVLFAVLMIKYRKKK